MIAPLLSCVFGAEDWGWEVFVGGVGLFFFLVVDEAIKRLLALCFRTSQECACVTVPAAEMGCFRF